MTPCCGRVELLDHISRLLMKSEVGRFLGLDIEILCSKEHVGSSVIVVDYIVVIWRIDIQIM